MERLLLSTEHLIFICAQNYIRLYPQMALLIILIAIFRSETDDLFHNVG